MPEITETFIMIKEIDKKLDIHISEHKFICQKIDELIEEFKKQDEKNEKKFSGKWVEKSFVSILSVIGTIILIAILALIIKPDLIK